MRGNIKTITGITLMVLLTSSCGVIGKSRKSTGNKEVKNEKNIEIKNIGFYDCSSGKILFKGYAKMVKDSAFVITVLSKSGIVGGKAYIFRDKAIIINRITKEYYLTDTEENLLTEINDLIFNEINNRLKKETGINLINGYEIYVIKREENINNEIKIYGYDKKTCIIIKTKNIYRKEGNGRIEVKEQLDKKYKKVDKIEDLF